MATRQSLEKLETLHKVVEFLGNWQERTKKELLVNTFFKLVTKRRITAAKAVLNKMAQQSEPSLWRLGYINALEGMVVATEASRDLDVFINRVRVENSTGVMKKFIQQSNNYLHGEFDRGYFSAWADYLQTLKTSN